MDQSKGLCEKNRSQGIKYTITINGVSVTGFNDYWSIIVAAALFLPRAFLRRSTRVKVNFILNKRFHYKLRIFIKSVK